MDFEIPFICTSVQIGIMQLAVALVVKACYTAGQAVQHAPPHHPLRIPDPEQPQGAQAVWMAALQYPPLSQMRISQISSGPPRFLIH